MWLAYDLLVAIWQGERHQWERHFISITLKTLLRRISIRIYSEHVLDRDTNDRYSDCRYCEYVSARILFLKTNEILFWIILMKSSFWSGSQGKYKNNNYIKSWKVVYIVSIRSILSSYLNFRNTVSMNSLHRRAQCPQKNLVHEHMHVKILKLRASCVRRALLQTCFLPLSMIRLISHLFQINTKYSYIRKPSIYHLVMNVNDYIPVHCFKNEHANYRKFTNQTVYQWNTIY